MLLVLLQQRSVSDVKDPEAALVEATGQLVAVGVVGTALDDLPGGCQLKQLGMGGEVPPSDGPVGRHCAVLPPTTQTLFFVFFKFVCVEHSRKQKLLVQTQHPSQLCIAQICLTETLALKHETLLLLESSHRAVDC